MKRHTFPSVCRSQQSSNVVKKGMGREAHQYANLFSAVLLGGPGLHHASWTADVRMVFSRLTTYPFWLHCEVGAKALGIRNPTTSS